MFFVSTLGGLCRGGNKQTCMLRRKLTNMHDAFMPWILNSTGTVTVVSVFMVSQQSRKCWTLLMSVQLFCAWNILSIFGLLSSSSSFFPPEHAHPWSEAHDGGGRASGDFSPAEAPESVPPEASHARGRGAPLVLATRQHHRHIRSGGKRADTYSRISVGVKSDVLVSWSHFLIQWILVRLWCSLVTRDGAV